MAGPRKAPDPARGQAGSEFGVPLKPEGNRRLRNYIRPCACPTSFFGGPPFPGSATASPCKGHWPVVVSSRALPVKMLRAPQTRSFLVNQFSRASAGQAAVFPVSHPIWVSARAPLPCAPSPRRVPGNISAVVTYIRARPRARPSGLAVEDWKPSPLRPDLPRLLLSLQAGNSTDGASRSAALSSRSTATSRSPDADHFVLGLAPLVQVSAKARQTARWLYSSNLIGITTRYTRFRTPGTPMSSSNTPRQQDGSGKLAPPRGLAACATVPR